MNLSNFRDKIISFLIPVVLAGGLLGSMVWIIGSTYFWDTSRLTLILSEPAEVTIDIDARLIYRDFVLFWIPYSFRIVLPWSRTETCSESCTLERLPAGDAVIRFVTKDGAQRIPIALRPDTQGDIDTRPTLNVIEVSDQSIFAQYQALLLTQDEEQKLGTIVWYNQLQWLYLIGVDGQRKIYDAQTKQILWTPVNIEPDIVGRGPREGTYFLYSREWMMLYDRYGRTAPTILWNYTYENFTLTWSGDTTLSSPWGIQELEGIWWPIEKWYITNGSRILLIQERQ